MPSDSVAMAALRGLGGLERDAYLVGGAVRDRLLGRPTADYDVAVAGNVPRVARGLAREVRGHAFELSDGFGAWRIVARDHAWQIDLLPLHADGLESDLGQRDFTVNAMAESLADGSLVDPFGGRADLAARRLRTASAGAFAADPLRTLRLVRLACELGFGIDAATWAAAAAQVSGLAGVAPERVFAELRRIIASDDAVAGVDRLGELGALDVVLPELSALRGVEQSQFHHLDVFGHTMATLGALIDLERDPARWFGDSAPELDRFLGQPLANELTRWEALRFGALFHDIGKVDARAVSASGRTTFLSHDVVGAEIVAGVLGRLRASQRLIEYVAALARHHLRLGFLVHDVPLSRRAVYRYLQACEPVEVDVSVLSVADRLATRGKNAERAIARHLDLARELVADALRWHAARPRPPLRGDELMRELGLRPGPRLGQLLRELEQAAYAGEIGSREQALARARALVQGEYAGGR